MIRDTKVTGVTNLNISENQKMCLKTIGKMSHNQGFEFV